MSLTGWMQNAVSYDRSNEAGKCPKCGSAKVKVEEHVNGERRSLSFLCAACGSGDHFDGRNPKAKQ